MSYRYRQRIAKLTCSFIVWAAVGTVACPSADAAEQLDYLGPSALAVSQDAETLYVACAGTRQVLFLDLPDGTIMRRVTLPAEPTDLRLTPDGMRLIAVCAASESTIVILDSRSGRRLASIPAGHTATAAAISPDGSMLYVCNRFDNDVSVIDLEAGREIKRVPAVREPIAAAVTPDGQTLLVANHLPLMRTDIDLLGEVNPIVTVVDTRTFETSSIELPNGANGLRGLAVSADGTYAFVTHLLSNFQSIPNRLETGWINTNVVSIIRVNEKKLTGTIGLDEFDLGAGNPWDIACTGDGRSVCVSLSGTHELSVIDYSVLISERAFKTMSPMMAVWPIYPNLGGSLWQRLPLPGKGPRRVTVTESRAYVAEYFSDTVAVVDLADPAKPSVRTIALGPPPKLTLARRGESLFHDATLCYQHWQSCASCHPDGRSDALTWDLLNDGMGNPKSTKSLLLSHKTPPVMAEGVRESAHEAVRSGLVNILFTFRPENDAIAIDAYLQSLKPPPSPYLIGGRRSAAAERGSQLYHSRRAGCSRCHPSPHYTDLKLHNVGTRNSTEYNDRFDTPTLIEVWRTAPYLHDGRYTTIQQLLNEGRHGLNRNHDLTEQELSDLAEFVLSL